MALRPELHPIKMRPRGIIRVQMSSLGLPPKKLAERIGKNVSTLAEWRAKGKGPPFIECEGRIHYPESEIERWLKRHTRGEVA